MIRYKRLEHQFVLHVPPRLEPGVLYISMEYGTAAHSCCCGCGEEVVTPFTPTDWRMTYDGETVSLHPSIGNWTLACRSHYVVDCGRVVEALPWTVEQIAAGRRADRVAKAIHYGSPESTGALTPVETSHQAYRPGRGMLSRVRRLTSAVWRFGGG